MIENRVDFRHGEKQPKLNGDQCSKANPKGGAQALPFGAGERLIDSLFRPVAFRQGAASIVLASGQLIGEIFEKRKAVIYLAYVGKETHRHHLMETACPSRWRDATMTEWIEETLHPDFRFKMKVDRVLFEGRSENQHVAVVDNGRSVGRSISMGCCKPRSGTNSSIMRC